MIDITYQRLVNQRLVNQRLVAPSFTQPAEVVAGLVALQAQDYAAARWAVGQRLDPAAQIDDAAVQQAFDAGQILRTHVLRPTWHFIAPADIRWLMALSAPRVQQVNRGRYRQLDLTPQYLARCERVLEKELLGGDFRTRAELGAVLGSSGSRLAHTLMHAELQALICSGPRRGKQFTYALLDERAPAAASLHPADPLAELARRYFSSRGPATAADFAYWSGLTLTAARSGLEAVNAEFEQATFDDQTYVFPAPAHPALAHAPPVAHFLSIYDEYISSYKDRGAMLPPAHADRFWSLGGGRGNAQSGSYGNLIVINGRAVGLWKRTLAKERLLIETEIFPQLSAAETKALAAAAQRYGDFMGLTVEMRETSF